jgi:uncharacterized protein
MKKLYKGKLAKGCEYCIKGEKLVLFVTGLCSRDCFYCPISEVKKNKDVIYANERPVFNVDDLIEEVKSMDAKGCGITGGDPLIQTDRTGEYINALKKKFGDKFHVHLYTSITNSFNEKNLKKLEEAGLDELRVHPDIFDDKLWNKFDMTKNFKFDLGVEIPIIPGNEKNVIKLIEYFKDKVNFFNLNELEISELNVEEYMKRGLKIKDQMSYAIKGSQELGKWIIQKYPKLNIHLCDASFKDKTQLGERILRTAKNVKKEFDTVTEDGMLLRGVIYTEKYEDLKNILSSHGIPEELIFFDKKNKRVLTSVEIIKKLKKELKNGGYILKIVEEYPTYDHMEVSSEPL